MPHQHRHRARAAIPEPEAIANAFPMAEANPQETLVSVVYVTASKTFEGPIGGYTTLGVPEDTPTQTPIIAVSTPAEAATPSSTETPKAKTTAASTPVAIDTKTSAKSTAHTTMRTSSGLPASIVPTSSVATSLAIAVASTSLSSIHHSPTLSSTASQASATSAASSSSGGMSSAGKAGLAVGLVLLFGTVIALVIFFVTKKRKDKAALERIDDEKSEIFGGAGRQASTRTAVNAPRLSLRPVTQFLPNLGEKRQSRGNALAMAAPATPAKNGSGWERPLMSQDANRNNPFGNHAESIDATNANGPTVVNSVGPGGEIVAGAVTEAAAAADAAGVVGLTRGASKREGQPKQIDFTKGGPFRAPPSPSGTEFSMSSETPSSTQTTSRSGSAIAAAGGPAHTPVHRVQLDFKPSMKDELELRAGGLVRMLHEYDDGWALCIRLDRSQQGVCPRTCLSTRPVKPRPQQNGPRGPPPPGMRVPGQGRPMSPAMNQGPPRAMSPAGNRPTTPQGAQGRPTGPQKSMTPQSQSRPLSPSSAQMQGRRNTPPGPSPMKPVTQTSVVAQCDDISLSNLSQSPPSDGPIQRKPVGVAL